MSVDAHRVLAVRHRPGRRVSVFRFETSNIFSNNGVDSLIIMLRPGTGHRILQGCLWLGCFPIAEQAVQFTADCAPYESGYP